MTDFLFHGIVNAHEIMPFASLVISVGSLAIAFSAKRDRERKADMEFQQDLHFVLTQLLSFYYYLLNRIFVYNRARQEDIEHIHKNIMSLKKDFLEIESSSFYNKKFSVNVESKLSSFIIQYRSWQGYQPQEDNQVFQELQFVCLIQEAIFEVLDSIRADYSDDASIQSFYQGCQMKSADKQRRLCESIIPNLKFIGNNIYYLEISLKDGFFHMPAGERNTLVQNVIYNCLYFVLNGDTNASSDSEENRKWLHKLFQTEITNWVDALADKEFEGFMEQLWSPGIVYVE